MKILEENVYHFIEKLKMIDEKGSCEASGVVVGCQEKKKNPSEDLGNENKVHCPRTLLPLPADSNPRDLRIESPCLLQDLHFIGQVGVGCYGEGRHHKRWDDQVELIAQSLHILTDTLVSIK